MRCPVSKIPLAKSSKCSTIERYWKKPPIAPEEKLANHPTSQRKSSTTNVPIAEMIWFSVMDEIHTPIPTDAAPIPRMPMYEIATGITSGSPKKTITSG